MLEDMGLCLNAPTMTTFCTVVFAISPRPEDTAGGCAVRKRFSRERYGHGRSKPACRMVGSFTKWKVVIAADFLSNRH